MTSGAAPMSPTEAAPLEDVWSIGIYHGRDPLSLRPLDGVRNPVLTAAMVDDVDASFVADPFHLAVGGTVYLFFEVWNRASDRGEIAFATSPDGLAWSYGGVVLREPFHLSYPCVVEHGGNVYMIPETRAARGVRLYRAVDFPRRWEPVGEILAGDFADATPLWHRGAWWLFVHRGLDELRLFLSDRLDGGWREHPASPIVAGNRRRSRPAGRLLADGDRLLRFSQDAWPHYGSRVRALAVDLDATGYAEREVAESPILEASGEGWNAQGMHHVDYLRRGADDWLAIVDGYTLGSRQKGQP